MDPSARLSALFHLVRVPKLEGSVVDITCMPALKVHTIYSSSILSKLHASGRTPLLCRPCPCRGTEVRNGVIRNTIRQIIQSISTSSPSVRSHDARQARWKLQLFLASKKVQRRPCRWSLLLLTLTGLGLMANHSLRPHQ